VLHASVLPGDMLPILVDLFTLGIKCRPLFVRLKGTWFENRYPGCACGMSI
jgi:hypothetical protein